MSPSNQNPAKQLDREEERQKGSKKEWRRKKEMKRKRKEDRKNATLNMYTTSPKMGKYAQHLNWQNNSGPGSSMKLLESEITAGTKKGQAENMQDITMLDQTWRKAETYCMGNEGIEKTKQFIKELKTTWHIEDQWVIRS